MKWLLKSQINPPIDLSRWICYILRIYFVWLGIICCAKWYDPPFVPHHAKWACAWFVFVTYIYAINGWWYFDSENVQMRDTKFASSGWIICIVSINIDSLSIAFSSSASLMKAWNDSLSHTNQPPNWFKQMNMLYIEDTVCVMGNHLLHKLISSPICTLFTLKILDSHPSCKEGVFFICVCNLYLCML